ncbi:hypothetical protein JCM10212_004837, partial [Sporobolomyces blumeae]
MTEPSGSSKKLFPLFGRPARPQRPPGQPSTADGDPAAPPRGSLPASSQTRPSSSSTATQDRKKPKRRRQLESEASRDSDCITLGSSDEDDPASSSTVGSSSRHRAQPKSKTKGAGKGKAKAIVVDSQDEEDDDLVVLKGPKSPSRAIKEAGLAKAAKEGKGKKANKRKKLKPTDSIDLTASPVRSSRATFSSGPSASFAPFAAFAPLSELYRSDRDRRKANEGVEPRWPTAEEHGGNVSSGSKGREWIAAPRFPRRHVAGIDEPDDSATDSTDFFSRFWRQVLDEPDVSSCARSAPLLVPPTYRDLSQASTSTLLPSYPPHPLLDRIASRVTASASPRSQPTPVQPTESELWTTKYGPRSANEVMGDVSRMSASILKEWLNELKVAGSEQDERSKKRRPITRGVDKKRKKRRKFDEFDDFLAGSSEEEDDSALAVGDPFASDLLEDAQDGPEIAGAATTSSTFRRLTNLILLVGPPGSGKTSTVQAIARELGFEIFEVNAGAGKRRAKDLETDVGDVGRNHIVRASPKKPAAKDFFSQFRQAGSGKGKAKDDGSEQGARGMLASGPTQSLILLEEVDVLYHDEHDFWT